MVSRTVVSVFYLSNEEWIPVVSDDKWIGLEVIIKVFIK
jgi:hypothetical protein